VNKPALIIALAFGLTVVLHELEAGLYVVAQFCNVHPIFCFEARRRPYNWPTKEEMDWKFAPPVQLPFPLPQ
jgi:hypothetical protein